MSSDSPEIKRATEMNMDAVRKYAAELAAILPQSDPTAPSNLGMLDFSTEMSSSAMIWNDEKPNFRHVGDTLMFKLLITHRMNLIFNHTSSIEATEVWNIVKKERPNWVGFEDKRQELNEEQLKYLDTMHNQTAEACMNVCDAVENNSEIMK